MFVMALCLFVLLVTLHSTAGDDYQVSLTVRQVAAGASVNIALEGTFGSTTSQSLGDNTLFNTNGVKGTFTITSSKPVGDILKFFLLRTDSITTTTVFISQISIQRKTVTRLYSSLITLTVGPGSNEFVIPNPDVNSTSLTDVDTGSEPDKNKIELREGDNKTIEASVITRNAQVAVYYRWYSQRNQQVQAILVSNVSRLEIVNAQQADSSRYFCVVTVDQSIVKLNTIEIQVNFLTMQPFQVTLTNHPFVAEGAKVEVKCTAFSNQANLEYEWKRDSNQISRNEIMKFEKVYRNNTGNYTCLATAANNFQASNSIHIGVNYLDVPQINNINGTNPTIEIKENEQLTLSCSSEGYPNDLKYTFSRDGVKLTTPENAINRLVMNVPVTGLYTCQVSNLYFSYKSSVLVNVTRITSTGGTGDDDDDEFWTNDKIIIFAMAGAFLIIILLLVLCICKLFRSGKTKDKKTISYHSSPHFVETGTTESHGIFYQSHGQENAAKNHSFQEENNDATENTKRKRNVESVSSDDYRSSNNDIHAQTTTSPKKSSKVNEVNGKIQLNGMTVEYC